MATSAALASVLHLPFAEQINFFRQKLNLPTERWDDIRHAAHDRAFVVAGAMQADLIDDLRKAMDKVIAEGTTLEGFRRDFREIVQRHGWTGWTGEDTAAGVAWRTRTIFETNLRTSYAAGRWQQLHDPALLAVRPYWRYLHSDLVRTPRPLHKHWGDIGLTLRHDHPFWLTHYPPNGWGCRCRVEAVRAPAEGDATEPPEGWDEVLEATGAPAGIDEGWGYAPGANAGTPLLDLVEQKLFRLDAPVGAAMWKSLAPTLTSERVMAFSGWLRNVLADPIKRGRVQVVGALSVDVLDWLAVRDISPATAEIAVNDAVIVGKKAQRHAAAGDALSDIEWASLPIVLAQPERVLYDNRSGHLIYVAASADSRQAKLTVEFDYKQKKARGEINLIVSAFKTPAAAIDGEIKGGFFEVVK